MKRRFLSALFAIVLIACSLFMPGRSDAQLFRNGSFGHSILIQGCQDTSTIFLIRNTDTNFFPLGRQKVKLSHTNVTCYEIVTIQKRTHDTLWVETNGRNSEPGSCKLAWTANSSVDLAITNGQMALLDTTLVVGTGTVTSVGLALPSIFTISGSPVTTSGTLTGTLATQSANLVFAGPSSGAAVAPTFRSLVVNDLPTVDILHGGTGQVTANAALNALLPTQTSNAGKVLQTDGTNTSWVASGGAGSVTNVGTGNGLQGGPITTTGTIDLRLNASGGLIKTLGAGSNELGIVAQVSSVPAALTANTNNWVLSQSAGYYRISNSTAGSVDLTGIDNTSGANGRLITLVNVGTQPIVLRNQSASSLAANQFYFPGDIILAARGTVVLIYDGTASVWQLIATN